MAILSPADAPRNDRLHGTGLRHGRPGLLAHGQGRPGRRPRGAVPDVHWGRMSACAPGTARSPGWPPGRWSDGLGRGREHGRAVAVWSVPRIKPFAPSRTWRMSAGDTRSSSCSRSIPSSAGWARRSRRCVGTGPPWVCRVGVQDRFSRYCGSYQYLMREHRLDLEAVERQVGVVPPAVDLPRARGCSPRPRDVSPPVNSRRRASQRSPMSARPPRTPSSPSVRRLLPRRGTAPKTSCPAWTACPPRAGLRRGRRDRRVESVLDFWLTSGREGAPSSASWPSIRGALTPCSVNSGSSANLVAFASPDQPATATGP